MEKHREQGRQGVVIVADCDHPSIDIERSVLADVAAEVRWLACTTEDEIIAQCGDGDGPPAALELETAAAVLAGRQR